MNERIKNITTQHNPFVDLPNLDKEPRFNTRVIENRKVGPEMIVVILERPNGFSFTPGQYIWLVLPKRSEKKGIVDRRAYSIVSSVDGPTIEILLRLTDNDYIRDVEHLSANNKVDIIGPMGSSFVPPKQGAIMISGGTGVAPFLSILHSALPGTFSLIHYNTKSRPLYCKDELLQQAKKNGFTLDFHIGMAKRVHLAPLVKKRNTRPIFIAGPQGFVDSITHLLLSLGVLRARLRYESFYPSSSASLYYWERFNDFYKKVSREDQSRKYVQRFPSVDHLFSLIAEQSTNHAVITDTNGVILFANAAAERITGYTLEEMRGQTARLWGGLMPSSFYKKIWQQTEKQALIIPIILNRHKYGGLYYARMHIVPILKNQTIIAYIATEEDITDLMELDKAKTEFVSLASHQLRTPLSTINGYTEMLLAGDAGKLNNEQRKYLEEVYKGNQRMVGLMNALLNVARLEMGTFVVEPEPTDVVKIAKTCVKELKPQSSEKKLVLQEKYDSDVLSTLADPKLLAIIFSNLLSNAVKYTPDGGSIKLSISKANGQLSVVVADTGYGIPKNQQNKIFTKLFRADNVREQDTEGTGLGLYIVKAIIDHSGGKISFESEENKGTTFYVTLPLAGMKKKEGTKALT